MLWLTKYLRILCILGILGEVMRVGRPDSVAGVIV
jgi:hypothetical protein